MAEVKVFPAKSLVCMNPIAVNVLFALPLLGDKSFTTFLSIFVFLAFSKNTILQSVLAPAGTPLAV